MPSTVSTGAKLWFPDYEPEPPFRNVRVELRADGELADLWPVKTRAKALWQRERSPCPWQVAGLLSVEGRLREFTVRTAIVFEVEEKRSCQRSKRPRKAKH